MTTSDSNFSRRVEPQALHAMSLSITVAQIVAQNFPTLPSEPDHCRRIRLIPLSPASELPTVTAEAAGSSPVVPAIFSNTYKLQLIRSLKPICLDPCGP
jgi:hypothetical protein